MPRLAKQALNQDAIYQSPSLRMIENWYVLR